MNYCIILHFQASKNHDAWTFNQWQWVTRHFFVFGVKSWKDLETLMYTSYLEALRNPSMVYLKIQALLWCTYVSLHTLAGIHADILSGIIHPENTSSHVSNSLVNALNFRVGLINTMLNWILKKIFREYILCTTLSVVFVSAVALQFSHHQTASSK